MEFGVLGPLDSRHPAGTGGAGSARRVRRPSPAAGPPGPSGAPPPADPFVGRGPELQVLEDALDDAGNGLPRVVLVLGEAGSGKSRMLDELMPHAAARGAQVLFGACQEDVGVPYLPVASAFAALGEERNPFTAPIRAAAGEGADSARLGLFLAATRALLGAARDRVVVPVIEDLHWADDSTLALLRHLVAVGSEDAARDRARLTIVLTSHRPAPGTAVEHFVGRLRRRPATRVIELRALSAPEVRELATGWLGRRPSPATVDLLLDATGGNPLVLRSTLGRLRELGGAVTPARLPELLGPTDLDHELWRRIERVGDACTELLRHAAILGDGAPIDWLAAVAGIDGAALDALIDEAVAAGVVVADDERYRFEHPQLRRLVYVSMTADDRASRHVHAADRLAPLGADAVLVAHHLIRAGPVVDRARLLAVCGEAADDSARIGAWRDAATYAATALEAAGALDVDDRERAALELRAGRAAFLARDRDEALEHLAVAAELGRSSGAVDVWGRAVVRLAREAIEDREMHSSTARSLAALDEFVAAAGDGEQALRAEAHALQAELHADRDDLAAARRHLAAAEELAAEVDDDELRTKVTFARGLHHLIGLELDDARRSLDAAAPIAAGLADPNPRIWCLTRLGMVTYMSGDLVAADALLADAMRAAHDADNRADYSLAAAVAAATSAARGHFARVEDDGERARRAYVAAEYWFTPGVLFPTLASARAHRGDAPGAAAALDGWEAVQERRSRRYRPLVDALTGDERAARAALEPPPFRLFGGTPAASLLTCGAVAAQVELGARTSMPALVAGPLESLVELYDRGMRFTIGWPAFVPRVVALGFAASGRAAEAAEWFERALDDARAAGADAEIARTALDHAAVLHARGEHTRAEDLVVLARAHYDAMSVTPAGPGAALLAPAPAAPARAGEPSHATRVILVTDLVGSTALNVELGDRDYVALLREHDATIRGRLADHDGVEFKHTGDGIAAWFYSVDRALECAVALNHDFADAGTRSPAGSLGVKIALSAGEPALVDGDLLGLAVTIAFRVLDHARPGEVLVTSEVAGLARGLAWAFDARGHRRLKGIGEPVDLLVVARPAAAAPAADA